MSDDRICVNCKHYKQKDLVAGFGDVCVRPGPAGGTKTCLQERYPALDDAADRCEKEGRYYEESSNS